MDDQLVSYQTALLAKQKGFDYPTVYAYGKHGEKAIVAGYGTDNHNAIKDDSLYNISAPSQAVLAKWLRDKHDIFIHIDTMYGDTINYFMEVIRPDKDRLFEVVYGVVEASSYEEAMEDGLLNALNILNEN